MRSDKEMMMMTLISGWVWACLLDSTNLGDTPQPLLNPPLQVVHKASGRVLVLKMNKHRSNSNSMLREMQLMNKLRHPNILR